MGGSQPSTTTQNVIQQTQLPEWYQQYLQTVMGKAVAASNEPYQAYSGQRIAGLTPFQQTAYSNIEGMQGRYQPVLNDVARAINNAGGVDFIGESRIGNKTINQGMGDISQGVDQITAAGNTDTASAMLPFAQQGAGYLTQSTRGSGAAAGNPYLQAAAQPTGLMAATPFLSEANMTAPQVVSSYLNPYNDAVTKQIATLGERNLRENILPSLSDAFVSAGQSGSGREADLMGRAARDTQSAILAQQAGVLQQGYGQGLSAAQADLARQGGLAGTAGGLGGAQQQTLLGVGQAVGGLTNADLSRLAAAGVDISQIGTNITTAQAQDAARRLAAGQSVGNLGVQQGQIGLQQGQLGLAAAQAAAANQLAAANASMGLAGTAQGIDLKNAAALESAGAAQQGQQQQNLNTAYQDFLEQRGYPWQSIGNLSAVVQGLPVGGTTSGTTQTTAPGPSTAAQVGGIGLGVAGLANSGLFKASGGAVKKPKSRQRFSYGHMPRRGLAIVSAA